MASNKEETFYNEEVKPWHRLSGKASFLEVQDQGWVGVWATWSSGMGFGTRWSLRLLPFQTTLWFCGLCISASLGDAKAKNLPGTTSYPWAEFVSHTTEKIKPHSWLTVFLVFHSFLPLVSFKLTLFFQAKPPLPFGWYLGCTCQPGWGSTPPLEVSVGNSVLTQGLLENPTFFTFSLADSWPIHCSMVFPTPTAKDCPWGCWTLLCPPTSDLPVLGLLSTESTSVSNSVPGQPTDFVSGFFFSSLSCHEVSMPEKTIYHCEH